MYSVGQKKPGLRNYTLPRTNRANDMKFIHLKAENQQILFKKNQYEMRSPLHSMTSSHRRFIDRTNPIRVVCGISSHSSTINRRKSLTFFGIFLSTFLLTILQRFSIGFRSGLLEGQSIISGILSRRKFLARRLVCFGSLSC